MICSTLIEQKAAALCLFSSIKTGLFRVERALPRPGYVSKQTSTNMMVARCQCVVGRHLSIQNNRVLMDENSKSVFLFRRTDHLISAAPAKLATFRVFIYSKMEHKINKVRRNLYASGKPRI